MWPARVTWNAYSRVWPVWPCGGAPVYAATNSRPPPPTATLAANNPRLPWPAYGLGTVAVTAPVAALRIRMCHSSSVA